MNFGKFTIDVVDTGLFALDGGAMFGVVPKTLWQKKYAMPDESNRIALAARPLLVRYDDKIILVDTGNGTKWNEKIQRIYNIDIEKSDMDYALSPFGLNRNDVTDVIFTHLHFDHSGGGTRIENGDIAPNFPNAKYYVQKDQYNWAMKPTEKDRASFLKENYEPLLSDGLLEFTEGEGNVLPGIRVLPIDGHTQAMQMILLDGGEEKLLYAADLCPTSAHVPIPYGLAYDNFPLTTIEEKKKYWARAVEENWTIVFEHDAYRQAGKIKLGEKGYYADNFIEITKG
jgi:glyoxylase-like metal-dependent hydrolase (beta-lactamase superfamily II)